MTAFFFLRLPNDFPVNSVLFVFPLVFNFFNLFIIESNRILIHKGNWYIVLKKKNLFLEELMLFSHQVVSNSSQPPRLQNGRLSCPSPSPSVCLSSCPLNQCCHPTISPLLASSPSAFNFSQHQSLFQGVSFLCQVPKILELSFSFH